MDMELKEKFMTLWTKYFNNADLPVVFFYSDSPEGDPVRPPGTGHQCLIGLVGRAVNGKTVCFDHASFGCHGGRRYLGYTHELFPNFEYFLSCGIEGKMEGERYKKTPEIVRELMKQAPDFEAPAKYIIFKRWDMLNEADDPAVAVFFATPDVLSGLFTLAGFEESERESVIAPFCSGCASIVQHPFLEKDKARPRAVLGMFDVSARPYILKDRLSLAIPMNKFSRMVNDMDQSFLITGSWRKVQKRIP